MVENRIAPTNVGGYGIMKRKNASEVPTRFLNLELPYGCVGRKNFRPASGAITT
jgi:hypothetical protein